MNKKNKLKRLEKLEAEVRRLDSNISSLHHDFLELAARLGPPEATVITGYKRDTAGPHHCPLCRDLHVSPVT